MKKILITVLVCVTAFGIYARPHGGPIGFGHGPAPAMHHGGHRGPSIWGHGGRHFWGGFGGAVLGTAIVNALVPSVYSAPVYSAPVYQPPVVVQQPAPVVVQPQVTVNPAPVVINNSNQIVVPQVQQAQPVYRKVEKKIWVPSDVVDGKLIPGHYDVVTEYVVVQ